MSEIAELPQDLERLRADCRRLELDGAVLRDAGADARDVPYNPTVCMHDGQLVACVRVDTGGVSITKNFLGTIDPQTWKLRDQREMQDLVREPARWPHTRSYGYQDVRLFVRRGQLGAAATVCDRVAGDMNAKMAVLELDQAGNVVECRVQPSDRLEKNWMPLADEQGLRFVYGLEPPIILTYDDAKHLVRPDVSTLADGPGPLRGSSQILRWKHGHLCVVHQVHAPWPTYVHRFVELDADLKVARIGRPFFFREQGIEFCAGAALWESRLVLSFGVRDREAWLALVDVDEVERLLGALAEC